MHKENEERMWNSKKNASVQLKPKKNLPFKPSKSNEFGGEDRKEKEKKSQDKYHGSMFGNIKSQKPFLSMQNM